MGRRGLHPDLSSESRPESDLPLERVPPTPTLSLQLETGRSARGCWTTARPSRAWLCPRTCLTPAPTAPTQVSPARSPVSAVETNCSEHLRTKVRKVQKVTELEPALNRGVAPGSSQVVTASVLSGWADSRTPVRPRGFGPCVALWPAGVCLLLTAHCPLCVLSPGCHDAGCHGRGQWAGGQL